MKSDGALHQDPPLWMRLVGFALVVAVVVLTSVPPSFSQAELQPTPIQFSPEVTELFKDFEKAIAEKKYDVAVKTIDRKSVV